MAEGSNYIIVVDIESTCWLSGQVPEGQHSEIIEIGYTLFNYQHNLLGEKGSVVVKPQHSTVSPFCTNLTGWTQEKLDTQGVTFQEACTRLTTELYSEHKTWASFGDYDRAMFEKMCQIYGVKYPFSPQHLNIKAISMAMLGKRMGVGKTITKLGLDFEGIQHSGMWDSWNAARILQHLTAQIRGDNEKKGWTSKNK